MAPELIRRLSVEMEVAGVPYADRMIFTDDDTFHLFFSSVASAAIKDVDSNAMKCLEES